MAMTVAGLAVGVAAVPVEPAPMGERGAGENDGQDNGEQCFHWLSPHGALYIERVIQPEMVICNNVSMSCVAGLCNLRSLIVMAVPGLSAGRP